MENCTAMFITNRDAKSSVQSVDLWIVDTDVQALNTIVSAPQDKFTYIKLGIPATDTYINDVQRLIFSDNNMLYWKKNANKINVVISYMEI